MTLLLVLVIASFVVLRPFISAVLWAMILTSSTWPAYARLESRLRRRKGLAALIMTGLAALLLLLPLIVLGSRLAEELTQIAALVRGWMEEGPPPPPETVKALPLVGGRLYLYLQSVAHDGAKLTSDMTTYVGPARQWLLATMRSLMAGITEMIIGLFIAFFLYRDGRAVFATVGSALHRAGGSRGEELLTVARNTVNRVIYGLIGTNLVEALLATVGLKIAGVPGAFFLGFATFFLTIVPFGPTLVFAPTILWLAERGATTSAVFLTAWFLVVFVIFENVLRSYLISRGGVLLMILVLLGVLGGILAFGLLGVFVGPTVLALGFTLVQQWTASETPVK